MAAPKLYGPRISTAVRLPEQLHQRAVAFATAQRVTRNRVIERALQEFLDRQDRADKRQPYDWSTTSPPDTP